MNMLPTNVQGTQEVEKRTAEIRFVDGKLEQKWVNVTTGEEVWRRVESFDKKGRQHG